MSPVPFVRKARTIAGREVNRGRAWIRQRLIGPVLAPWRRGEVAMLHIGRSGSTVLGDLLQQHPDVFWDGEVYERDVFGPYPYDGVPSDLEVSPRRLIASRLPRAGRRFYGFETKFFHLDLTGATLSEFTRDLEALGFSRYVILRRDNFLRKIVSSLIAHESGRFHRASGSRASVRRVRVDVQRVGIDRQEKSLLAFLEDFEARFEALDTLLEGRSVLRLSYERDVEPDPRIAYGKMCEFIGIRPRDVDVRYGRTNAAPLRELVVNFEDVVRVLGPTRFAWMLDE